MGARPPDQVGPQIEAEFPSVFGKDFLPNLKLGTFAVDDQTVEIEDERFDHESCE
jgi:hypothetical protein